MANLLLSRSIPLKIELPKIAIAFLESDSSLALDDIINISMCDGYHIFVLRLVIF